ncbi:MAG: carbohydrate ABC transporter substrate-binding protein [Clostridiales bacterium]|nr:carbohydrate ABC transporter substrate-binding protein [Clostridiales bacterium]
MKKLLSLVLVVLMLLGSTTFAVAEEKVKLNIWSFTNELEGMINKYFVPAHPDIEITYTLYPTDAGEYTSKVDALLGTDAANAEAPDVFALEAAFVKKYVDSEWTANLADLGFMDADYETCIPAMVQIGTDNATGAHKALAWQSTPGALFYRASLAEKYLGVKSPEEFQAKVADWDAFMETAYELKDASQGAVKMFCAFGDIWNAYQYSRSQPWVVDGKLVVDDVLLDFVDLCKEAETDDLYGKGTAWQESWFEGMKTDSTLCYFLPTWGLHYVLKPNCGNYDSETDAAKEGTPGTYGDWRMVDGPVGYSWGGTWLGANAAKVAAADDAKMAAIKEFIRFFTLDADFLYTYAKDSGDFVSNNSVVQKIVDEGGLPNPFLGGQDHYSAFASAAMLANGAIMSRYDETLNTLWQDNVTLPYSKGEVEFDAAIATFKEKVAAAYADLTIE